MRILIPIICLVFSSCAGVQLNRVNLTLEPGSPPQITGLIDLGGLAQSKTGSWNQNDSDGRFSPGEWMAVVGRNLASSHTTVTMSGTRVPVEGYFEGGSILVRIPRHLPLEKRTPLSVKTMHGFVHFEVEVSHHIILSDLRANVLRFWRTNHADKNLVLETAGEIPLSRACCHTLSIDGALLYATAAKGERVGGGAQKFKIKTIHLGAPSAPTEIYQTTFEAVSKPRQIMLSPTGDKLYILTDSELKEFSLATPIRPTQTGSISFEGGGLTDMALVKSSNTAVLLNPTAGKMTAVDLSKEGSPVVIDQYNLPTSSPLYGAIGLVADNRNPNRFWVLLAGNLRVNDSNKKPALGDKPSLLSMKIDADKFALENKFKLEEDLVPFHLSPARRGGVLINGVHAGVREVDELSPSVSGLQSILNWLKDTSHAGRIVHVSADGKFRTMAEGMSVYLTSNEIGFSNTFAFSALRLAPRFIPPVLGVDLHIEIFQKARARVHKLKWTAVLPPYHIPSFTVQ